MPQKKGIRQELVFRVAAGQLPRRHLSPEADPKLGPKAFLAHTIAPTRPSAVFNSYQTDILTRFDSIRAGFSIVRDCSSNTRQQRQCRNKQDRCKTVHKSYKWA
jgi:hypothetical protein